MYVYEPSCVKNNSFNIPCYAIEKVKRTNNVCYKDFFKENPFTISKKYVFLNAWFENKEEYQLQTELCIALIKAVGAENVCIKLHPNELKNLNRISGVEYIDSKCSFEVSNYYQDWSEHVFISAISTASISPKMVYGDIPCVIYLYKIFQKEFHEWQGIDGTIALLEKMYGDKNKFYCPENMEIYTKILTNIENSTGQQEEPSDPVL